MNSERNKKNNGFTLIEMIVVIAIFLFVMVAAISIFISTIQQQKKVLAEQQVLNQISYAEEHMSKALRMAAVDNATTDPAGNCMVYTNSSGVQQGGNNSGYIYLLTRYDTGLGFFRGIKFINPSDSNACQEFVWDANGLEEYKNGAGPVPLTSSSLKINFAKFSINGSGGSTFNNPPSCAVGSPYPCGASYEDTVQPRVTILLNVIIPGGVEGAVGACSSNANCSATQACDTSINKCVPARIIQTTVSQRNLNVNNGQR